MLPVVAEQLTDAKRRIIDRLKRVESATAPELAAGFGLTDTAVRQHLEALEALGVVERAPSEPAGRGRPPVAWHLTDLAMSLFPDRHADLTVELITSIRDALGEEGLSQVIDTRSKAQEASYRQRLPEQSRPIAERVEALARIRSAEGYLAEAAVDGEDGIVLVEHHCPIADAARTCTGLCQSELELFRRVLGDGVAVERTQHLIAGDMRCAYRIRAKS
jgi:predicted ArsR family transcriptional regulator